jgi:exonuclease III
VEEVVLNNNYGRMCIANIVINNKDVYIVNLYAQHISNIKDTKKIHIKQHFYESLTDLINSFNNKNLIILGDFNANKSREKEFICPTYKKPPPGFYDIEMKIYNTFLENTKLINLYKFNGIYSYYSQRTKEKYIMFKHNKGLTVDSIMINNKLFNILNNTFFEILKKFYILSDHLPLYANLVFK